MTKTAQKKNKVCYVLCYRDPRYIRTQFLLDALNTLPSVQLSKAINTYTGLLRYIETPLRLIVQRLRHRPQVYVVGFRSVELLWLIRLLTFGKPLVYDEFINPYLWLVEEHHQFSADSLRGRLLRRYTGWALKTGSKVLSDTKAHAKYSSKQFNIPLVKFQPVYVGTNENLFTPHMPAKTTVKKPLQVFFYGRFLPLHGVSVITEAARQLQDLPIQFTIIGAAYRRKNDHLAKGLQLPSITHIEKVPFEQLPEFITKADVCLGGPFGGTPQAQKVITGKTYQFMAMAKPTIIGIIGEAVGFNEKHNCLLVKQNDPIALTDTIRWCYQNQAKLPAIGRAGQKLYQSKFSLQAQAPVLEKLLNDLVY